MYSDRRDFVIRGTALALLGSVPWFAGSCNQAGKTRPDQAREDHALSGKLSAVATEILRLASRAPSGHNTQPWTVRILGNEHWILGVEQTRRLPAVDPNSRETLLSIGAFLENLIMAAAHFGFYVQYELLAHTFAEADIIDLQFRPSRPSPQPLHQITLRRTVRSGLLASEIKSADLRSIHDSGEGVLYLPRGSAGAKYLAEGTLKANRQQAFRDPAERELADWIRWSRADAAKYRNGLTPASMEIEGLAGWYVSHFYNRAAVLSKSFREKTIRQVRDRVGEGGGWLVLSNSGSTIATLIETGRKFERMWLRLRDRNIAIHPMTQMLEESPWSQQVARNLGIDGTAQFILRIGYLTSYPNPASLRMPPDWIATESPAPRSQNLLRRASLCPTKTLQA